MSKVDSLVVIVGETASGKSGLALELAKKFNGEIICADSWTVYKDFDIGTAKPSKTEQHQVVHHLLDVADPNQGFSAAIFKRLAVKKIEEIIDRDKLPVLVGGTGLYIDSILFDYGFLPAASADERSKLNKLSINELLGRIKKLNFNTEGIDLRNKRRLIRLIENNGQRPTKQQMRPDTLVLGLSIPREELEKRLTERTDAMLALGLEKEVEDLSERYGWEVEPMKGIGYREWRDYFKGIKTEVQIHDEIIRDSLQLAKKQRTWFKRNKYIQWLDDPSQAVDLVTTFLNT